VAQFAVTLKENVLKPIFALMEPQNAAKTMRLAVVVKIVQIVFAAQMEKAAVIVVLMVGVARQTVNVGLKREIA